MTNLKCHGCNNNFLARAGAKTCSAKCRKRLQRAQAALTLPDNGFISTGTALTKGDYPKNSIKEPLKVISVSDAEEKKVGRSWRYVFASIALLLLGGYFVQQAQNNSESLDRRQSASVNGLKVELNDSIDSLELRVASIEDSLGVVSVTPSGDGTTTTGGSSGASGAAGSAGAAGPAGAAGATGATGPQGIAGSNDCISGICVSRQTTTPGAQEVGSINIDGTVIAAFFSGSGASLTSLNGTNVSSGTVADARLSTNVTLQGNTFNGASQLVQLTVGGLLPVLDGSNLTNLTGANVTGNISGNAGTATALATNPSDCAANTYATTIAASGNLTCASITDASLSANVTLQGNSFNGVSQLVQLTAGGILPILNGSNLTNITGANVTGNISGNAGTATALAADPSDCAANTYATTIAASGNLTCASTTDASLSANVTLQGNTFNGLSQLVQTTAGGLLPVLDASNLTTINASNLSSGTVADARISGTYTSLTGTGALGAGSITSGFGAIDTGADNITTTGTLQGTTSVLTTLVDTASAVALDIGTTNATAINLKKSTAVTGSLSFTTTLLEDGNEILANMVTAFPTACPTGWTEYTAARGRYIVGTPSGGTDTGTSGTALTNLESRAVGQHTHIQDAHNHTQNAHNHGVTDPSHAHSVYDPGHVHGIPQGDAYVFTGLAGGHGGNYIGEMNTRTGYTGIGIYGAYTGISINNATPTNNATTATNQNAGSVAGTNAPYIQMRYCQKTAGSDLAEWTDTNENLTPGMIVSIDKNDAQKIVSSKVAYDETASGVVSTEPGWTLGTESKDSKDKQVQLALTGRVPTLVSTINGDIKAGDPITTSDIPGVGMKATKSGTIIGRAMEDLAASSDGTGKVTVLLNTTHYEPASLLSTRNLSLLSLLGWGIAGVVFVLKRIPRARLSVK